MPSPCASCQAQELYSLVYRQLSACRPEQSHGPPANDASGHKCHNGIHIADAPPESAEQTGDGAEVGQYVAEDMQVGGPAVDVAVTAVEQVGADEIRGTAHDGHHERLTVGDVDLGMEESVDGLDEDEHGDEEQQHTASIGREVEDAVGVPPFIAAGLQAPHQHVGCPTESEHEYMTAHVGSLGQQGHGMRAGADDELADHHDKGYHHHGCRTAFAP